MEIEFFQLKSLRLRHSNLMNKLYVLMWFQHALDTFYFDAVWDSAGSIVKRIYF